MYVRIWIIKFTFTTKRNKNINSDSLERLSDIDGNLTS